MSHSSYVGQYGSDPGVHTPQELRHSKLVLAADSRPYLDAGTPEVQVFRVLDDAGTPMSELKVKTLHATACRQDSGGSWLDSLRRMPGMQTIKR
jgi:hypothetical protein